ncbi:MAG: hypothetical protein Fur006_41000 [Coleofasciculaceae cyanobacterium]
MAAIRINDLKAPGFELLADEESYLNELTTNEVDMARGGLTPVPYVAALWLSYSISKEAKRLLG